jgi:excisionase family DNA binding protein
LTDSVFEFEMPRSRKEPIRSDEKLLVSRAEAAGLLSISKRALDYLIANGVLSVRRIGSRVLIRREELERFARGNHPKRLAG